MSRRLQALRIPTVMAIQLKGSAVDSGMKLERASRSTAQADSPASRQALRATAAAYPRSTNPAAGLSPTVRQSTVMRSRCPS